MAIVALATAFFVGTVGLACAPGAQGEDPGAGDLFVEAVIDGAPYQGSSRGAVYSEYDYSDLVLFPADYLQGELFNTWRPGDTGELSLEFDPDADAASWLQYMDGTGATWVSQTGTLVVDTWQDAEPGVDVLIGTMSGTFESSLTCYMACDPASTVEVTDGQFRVMVEDATDAGSLRRPAAAR